MASLITGAEFADLFRTFRLSAWRLEAASSYKMDYEEAEFQRFIAGEPATPSDVSWWQGWLDWVRGWKGQGKDVGRVRVDDVPLSPYQRWLLWCEPWHHEAGEDIRHLPRPRATRLGLPLYDYWLFDDERLVFMLFNAAGEICGRMLIEREDSPSVVAQHCAWRDLAVRNATLAEAAAAT
jgi:hypothetical protein